MLWIKALHIIFMVTWFAGLFYLPRLFVYHSMTEEQSGRERFIVMERKLLGITLLGALLTALFGSWLIFLVPGFLLSGWMQVKLGIVAFLVIYHGYCYRLAANFRNDRSHRSHVWYRWFNEIPVLFLVSITLLVVVKPSW